MSKGNIRTEPQLYSSFQPRNYLWRAGFVVGTIVDIYLRREDYLKVSPIPEMKEMTLTVSNLVTFIQQATTVKNKNTRKNCRMSLYL